MSIRINAYNFFGSRLMPVTKKTVKTQQKFKKKIYRNYLKKIGEPFKIDKLIFQFLQKKN